MKFTCWLNCEPAVDVFVFKLSFHTTNESLMFVYISPSPAHYRSAVVVVSGTDNCCYLCDESFNDCEKPDCLGKCYYTYYDLNSLNKTVSIFLSACVVAAKRQGLGSATNAFFLGFFFFFNELTTPVCWASWHLILPPSLNPKDIREPHGRKWLLENKRRMHITSHWLDLSACINCILNCIAPLRNGIRRKKTIKYSN